MRINSNNIVNHYFVTKVKIEVAHVSEIHIFSVDEQISSINSFGKLEYFLGT